MYEQFFFRMYRKRIYTTPASRYNLWPFVGCEWTIGAENFLFCFCSVCCLYERWAYENKAHRQNWQIRISDWTYFKWLLLRYFIYFCRFCFFFGWNHIFFSFVSALWCLRVYPASWAHAEAHWEQRANNTKRESERQSTERYVHVISPSFYIRIHTYCGFDIDWLGILMLCLMENVKKKWKYTCARSWPPSRAHERFYQTKCARTSRRWRWSPTSSYMVIHRE